MKSKRSYIYLLAGLLLLLFTGGKFNQFILAWFPSIFIIRFFRSGKTIQRYVVASLSMAVISMISWYGIQPLPLPAYIISMTITSFISGIPFLLDRIMYKKVPSFSSTLIYPVIATLLEFLFISGNPMGSFGAQAYTQASNLPFIQIAALGGLTGISFLMSWFASCFNALWENKWKPGRDKGAIIALAALLISSHLYGSIRILLPVTGETVKASAIFKTESGVSLGEIMTAVNKGDFSKADKAYSSYLMQTENEARYGQKVISWPEGAVVTTKEELSGKLKEISTLAYRGETMIAAPFIILNGDEPFENSLYMFDISGEIILKHIKFGGNIFEGSLEGSGEIEWVKSGNSLYSSVICWDMDFPGAMSQTGRNTVDILIAPANDWKEITPVHGEMAIFRAVENGTSLIRSATSGLSVLTDYRGIKYSEADWFKTDETLIRGEIPASGVKTFYSRTGDILPLILALAMVIQLIHLVISAIVKTIHNHRKTAQCKD